MGDVEVAIDELHGLSSELKGLSSDLNSTDANYDYDVNELAHSTVVDAMNDFKGNWDDNRKHLGTRLEDLGKLAKDTADGFDETDKELAKELIKAMEEEEK